jgi:uncharacterized protein (TIGR03435 family)
MSRLRRILGLMAVLCLLCLIAVILVLHVPRERSPHWRSFAIGPAIAPSASVQLDGIRAEGISLKSAIALAYDVPTIRVIGPDWLAERRYSVRAVVPKDAINETARSWRPLLQQELTSLLRLQTHIEQRPFDVLVLTVPVALKMAPAVGGGMSAQVNDNRVRFRNATMGDLAQVLNGIVGMPVVDETGVRGAYDMEFGWREDRVPSITTALDGQYGLRLSPGRRDLEALIVDEARRDFSLVLVAQIERAMRAAPYSVRRHIAHLTTIR